jgi:pSer/pThr/pTyr-binding forkhead associated (FHA) protein
VDADHEGPDGSEPTGGPDLPDDEGRGRTEQAALLSATTRALPFVFYRDAKGRQRIYELPERGQVTIGRGSWMDISLSWDEGASRLHARLEPLGTDWTVVDDGTSRNGTFLNGERVEGRRRLDDGDELVVGETRLQLCMPGRLDEGATRAFGAEESP